MFESDPIIVTAPHTMTFADIEALYGSYAYADGGGWEDWDQIRSDEGGGIADIPFDIMERILDTFRITDDRRAAAARDEMSTFDRNNPNLLDVHLYNSDGSYTQWWFDTGTQDWWTDTNGEGTPDLVVRHIGGSWWADLDFNGTFEREVSPGG
jgi:hypothetical protein